MKVVQLTRITEGGLEHPEAMGSGEEAPSRWAILVIFQKKK